MKNYSNSIYVPRIGAKKTFQVIKASFVVDYFRKIKEFEDKNSSEPDIIEFDGKLVQNSANGLV